MTDIRCELTELLTTDCAHCRNHPGPEVLADRAVLLATRRWFPARFPGRCTECGEPFAVDTAIRGVYGQHGYIAECCVEAPVQPDHPSEAGRG